MSAFRDDAVAVVTIASAAGITVYPGYATSSPTRHSAMALTEAINLDLMAEGIGNVAENIAMPGIIKTDIMVPEKTSPQTLGLARGARHANRTVRAMERVMIDNVATAMSADELAQRVPAAAAAGEIYVLPNHEDEPRVAAAKASGIGRATGTNSWRGIYEGIMNSMETADAACA